MKNSLRICCCYAHADRPLLEGLRSYLLPLQRAGLVDDIWTDADISPGSDWKKEIRDKLGTAQIILLLVSADFLSSEYCYSNEMDYALERHKSGQARAIPIILRPSLWMNTALVNLQALPKYAVPVVSNSWSSLDEAFLDVAEGLRQVIEELSSGNQGALLSETLAETAIARGNAPRVVANAVLALDSIDPEQRFNALDTLGQMTHPVAQEALAGALNHPVRDVRIHAAQLLRRDLRAMPVFIEMLYLRPTLPPYSEGDAVVEEQQQGKINRLRILAIDALCQMGEPAIPALIEALDNENATVRERATEALCRYVDRRAIPGLVERLADSEESTRALAAQALTNFGESGVPILIGLYHARQDTEPLLSDAVRSGLVEWLASRTSSIPLSFWFEVLEDRDASIRREAIFRLMEQKDAQVVPALVRAFQRDASAHYTIAIVLKEIGETALSSLVGILQEGDKATRSESCLLLILALGFDAPKEGDDRGDDVVVTDFLMKHGEHERMVPVLMELLSDEDSRVRRVAASALKALGDKRAIPVLIESLSDEEPQVRLYAVEALGAWKDERAVPVLIEALNDENFLVQDAAEKALEGWQNERVVSALIEALRNEGSYSVRATVAGILESLGDKRAVPALIEALHDWELRVREAAASALGILRDRQAIPALMEALHNASSEREKAYLLDSLVRLRATDAIPQIVEELRNIEEESNPVRYYIWKQEFPSGWIDRLLSEDADKNSKAMQDLARLWEADAIQASDQSVEMVSRELQNERED